MLAGFRDASIKIWVVANCEYLEERYYLGSALPSLVDGSTSSCEFGVAKPHPRIYGEAITKIGIPEKECIYIGAGLSDELQGAAAVGIQAYQAYWFLRNLDEDHERRIPQPFKRLDHPLYSLLRVGR